MILPQSVTDKIVDFAPYAEQMPGVVIIHLIGEFPVVYMTSNGLQQLGVTLQELKDLGAEYHSKYFNIEDMTTFIPQLNNLLAKNIPGESFSYFQQVKISNKNVWTWHICATRIFMWDDDGKPLLTLTTAIPIDRMKHIEVKAERLLTENLFLKKNSEAFLTLTRRERIILALVAKGKSSSDIATELYISVDTVQTHRRNIKQKLHITTLYEITEYARAFDLI